MRKKRSIMLLSLVVAVVSGVHANVILDTTALPSAQGWSFSSAGMHSGLVESDMFSVSNSVLIVDNMAEPVNFSGGGAGSRISDVAIDAKYSILQWTSRTTAYEKDGAGAHDNGFYVGLGDGQYSYIVGISMDNIFLYSGGGSEIIPFDGTDYHTYRLETVAGQLEYDFYIDDTLRASLNGRPNSSSSFLVIGDATSTANAHAEISSFQFAQVPEPSVAGLMAVFGGGLYFARRRFRR